MSDQDKPEGEVTQSKDNPPNTGPSLADLQAQLVQLAADNKTLKSQYAGLQGQFSRQKGETETAQTQLASVSGSYENQLAELQNQLKTVQDELKTTSDAYALSRTELEAKQARDNARTLVKTFATDKKVEGLVELFDNGLMPGVESMDEAALTKFLETFSSHIDKFQKDAVKEVRDGTTPTPPAPSGSAAKTLDSLKAELQEALRSGGFHSERYKQVYAEYEKALTPAQQETA